MASIRSNATRTPIEAMGEALRAVRPADILGWFRHGGYQAKGSSDTINKKPL